MLFDIGKDYGLLLGFNKNNFLRIYKSFGIKWKIHLWIFGELYSILN